MELFYFQIVSSLYSSFARDAPCTNANHVLMIVEYLFGKEADLVFHYLIEYNLIFKLI